MILKLSNNFKLLLKLFFEYSNKNSLIILPVIFFVTFACFFGFLWGLVFLVTLITLIVLLKKYFNLSVSVSQTKSDLEIYYFQSPRCAGCLVSDILNNISGLKLKGDIKIIDVTNKNNRNVLKKYDIRSVPTWICKKRDDQKIIYRSKKAPKITILVE